MKKVFAVILAVVLVMSLSVTAFAAVQSPEGSRFNKVYIINGIGAKTETIEVNVGESVPLKADVSKGTFNEWTIYKMDGTPAVPGTDYQLEGKLTDPNVVITPLTNLIVTGNYDGKKTPFTITNGEPQSPQTGDSTVVVMVAVMALALAGACVAKKQLAK